MRSTSLVVSRWSLGSARREWCSGLVIVLGLASSGCAVTGAVLADRPGYTDAPTVLPTRSAQIEAGITDDHTDDVLYRSAGEVLLRVGIGHRTELRFFGNSIGVLSPPGQPSTKGFEDSKVGVKIALHTAPDSVHGMRLSLLAQSTLPTGADNRTAHKAQPEAKLAAAWTTSGPFSIYTNFGFGGWYSGSAWGTRGWASAALWYAASGKVSLFGEGIVTGRVSGSAFSSKYIDGGVTYLFSDHVQGDIRAGHGIGGVVSHEKFFGVGVAWRW